MFSRFQVEERPFLPLNVGTRCLPPPRAVANPEHDHLLMNFLKHYVQQDTPKGRQQLVPSQQLKQQLKLSTLNNISPTTSPPFGIINTHRKQGHQEVNQKTPNIGLTVNSTEQHTQLLAAAISSSQGNELLGGKNSKYQRPTEASRRYIATAKAAATAQFGATDGCRNITWQKGAVSREDKQHLLKQRGCVIWFTGLSGSGKSTVAITLEHALAAHGRLTTLLDGDNIRHGLNNNLGFSPEDRAENIRRIGEVSKLMMESGVMTLASFISPYQKDRALVRSRMEAGDFIEVHLNVPLEVCESRDPKGLYKLARAGKIKCFTGIDDPYEAPEEPEIVLEYLKPDGSPNSPDDMAATIVDYLTEQGFLPNHSST